MLTAPTNEESMILLILITASASLGLIIVGLILQSLNYVRVVKIIHHMERYHETQEFYYADSEPISLADLDNLIPPTDEDIQEIFKKRSMSIDPSPVQTRIQTLRESRDATKGKTP